MKLDFKPNEISDKELITSITFQEGQQNCDLAFSNICSWRFLYDTEFTIVDGLLLVRFLIKEKQHLAYMPPMGNHEYFSEAIHLMEEDANSLGHPFRMMGVTPTIKERLETLFPDEFEYRSNRNYFDYIYLREELATLKGKKFQQKRNHVNKFKKNYPNYEYIPLTADRAEECLSFENVWYEANKDEKDSVELNQERQSMLNALRHYKELDLKGGMIRVDDKPVAFTFGSPITPTTFGVHVEKADINFEGAYTIINQEFSSHIPEQYIYLNREEDLGIPGLRKAKLSYNPTLLLEKNMVVRKADL